MTTPRELDLLVVGGGINGVGIARDAAGRGLRVLLCEQHDLGAHTSSASTKLIHGGLRYVERLHVGLVRKALKEREVVLGAAPHISWALRFVIPHDERMRSAWMIRIGLVLYDNLARRRRLAASHGIDLRRHPAGRPLDKRFKRGFVYSDGWIDDARLVVLNALDAAERGATISTRTRCVALRSDGGRWHAKMIGPDGGALRVAARAVVNATGPWVAEIAQLALGHRSAHRVRLVKGSHIIVPALFQHEFAYIFQNPDRRVIFAIPYERDFTLIGTTDVDFAGDPAEVAIDASEVDYLVASANRYFTQGIAATDVVSTFSGVRPLLEDESSDPAAVTRDYTLELDSSGPPILSVFGGKLTTFRRLAEEAVDRLAAELDCKVGPWTAGQPLPGGDLPDQDFQNFERAVAAQLDWLPGELRRRYAHAYGTRVNRMLAGCRALADLGMEVVPGLYERELEYLYSMEWAQTAEDILWRRTKLGLHLNAEASDRVAHWLAARAPSADSTPSQVREANRHAD
jgi:glycerol-3-phosphate dehydrogenase